VTATEPADSEIQSIKAPSGPRPKLIEVALPLEAINTESALRKRKAPAGYPTGLHKWWAQRPLAACRAVLFSQLVDDPSARPELFPTAEAQGEERQRLFHVIEALVLWENSRNETVLHAARREIARCLARDVGIPEPETPEEVCRVLREHAPPVLDPFCGGGSIPLEAQRLGLEAYASDLNPVAVLITKALIPEGTVNRLGARCIVCGSAVPFDYVRAEGKAGRMSQQLMSIVAEGRGGRIYLSPTGEQERVADGAEPHWAPETDLPEQALSFRVQLYGMTKHRDLFSPRQLVALATLSDLVGEARARVRQDAVSAGLSDDGDPLERGGREAEAYADAMAIYLAFVISRLCDYGCTLASWRPKDSAMRSALTKQALPMVWDFAEGSPFGQSSSGIVECAQVVARCLEFVPDTPGSSAVQEDAAELTVGIPFLAATDPPYYDNIGYADLERVMHFRMEHV
jgi:adenine-specific DNA methylase